MQAFAPPALDTSRFNETSAVLVSHVQKCMNKRYKTSSESVERFSVEQDGEISLEFYVSSCFLGPNNHSHLEIIIIILRV